jgi:hypothetical protein
LSDLFHLKPLLFERTGHLVDEREYDRGSCRQAGSLLTSQKQTEHFKCGMASFHRRKCGTRPR